MFSKLSISEASTIAETLAFSGQLSVVYPFLLHLKHLPSFMSRDISTSEFRDIGVIVAQTKLDKLGKEVLLLDTGTWKDPVIAFKRTLRYSCYYSRRLDFFSHLIYYLYLLVDTETTF